MARVKRRCVKEQPRLKPFDLARYLGSEERNLPPPYTQAELVVLGAGALGLLAALAAPGPLNTRQASHAASKHNRRRFHLQPLK